MAEETLALGLAALVAIVSAGLAFLLITLVGILFFKGEGSYGFSLAIAPGAAVFTALAAFTLTCRKIWPKQS